MAANDYTISIGTDTKDLSAGLRKITQSFTALGNDAKKALQKPQADLQQLTSSLNSFASMAKGAMGAVVGGIGLKSLTTDFMNYHANLSNAVQLMRYDVTQVEALGGAMRRFGGDTNGAISTLDSLSSALQQAQWGTGALTEVAMKYGISFMKSNGQLMDAEELLQSLSSQLNTYDQATKTAIASQLGLDKALLRVIDTGNYDGLIAQQKALGTTTQHDLKVATDFESAMLDLKDTVGYLAKQVSIVLLPPLTRFMKYLTTLVQRFKDFKHQSLLAWGAVGGAIMAVAPHLATVFTALKGIMGLGNVFSGLQAGLKALTSPLGLLMGAFLMLLIVAEDLYQYFSGGQSIFGDLAAQFPIVKSFLDGLGAVFSTIKTSIGYVVDFFKDPSWANFKEMIDKQIELVKEPFLALKDWVVGLFTGIFSNITSKITEGASGVWEGIKSWWNGGDAQVSTKTAASPGGDGGSSQTQNFQNNKIDVTVNTTSSQPAAVGEAVATGVRDATTHLTMRQ